MKRLGSILLLTLVLLQACTGHKKLQKPAPEPAPVRKIAEPIVEKDPLAPFTRDLFTKLLNNQIDIKKVQFYIDQELILSKYQQNGKLDVDKQGTIVSKNGTNVNEIVIPANTPCVCELVEGDALRVSFDQSGSTLRFQNSRSFSPDFFVLTGSNWKDGTCEVDYDNSRYRLSCGTCGNAAEVKLLVKQSVLDNNDSKSRRITGHKVGGL